MKLNEKGLTLVELLATITIVSVVVISIIYVFTNFQNTARQQKAHSDAVNAARTVLEELKWALPREGLTTTTLFDDEQPLDLTPFRDDVTQPYVYNQLYYPSDSHRKFQITIKTIDFSKQLQYSDDVTIPIENYFRNIHIEITDLVTKEIIYTLQSYVEYN